MTSTPCESEALDRLVEQWAVKIARSTATTVEAIVSHAENVRAALRALKPHGRKARQLLAERSGLSRPMLSKLETIGRHAELLRHRAGFLPPSLSSLYALARKPGPEFRQAVMMDLRAMSRAEINALFAPPSLAKPTRKLMTILVPRDLSEAARRVLMADVAAALVRISEDRRVDLDVSLPAGGAKITQMREEQPSAEPRQEPCPEDRAEQADEPIHRTGRHQHAPRHHDAGKAPATGERKRRHGCDGAHKIEATSHLPARQSLGGAAGPSTPRTSSGSALPEARRQSYQEGQPPPAAGGTEIFN